MRQLVAQRARYLFGEQLPIVPEVAFERVAVNHDSVLVTFARDSVTKVLTVSMFLGAQIGDDYGDRLQHLLEFLRKRIDRIGDQRFELIEFRGSGHGFRLYLSPG